MRLLVGTRKGMWIGRPDEARREWDFDGPHHPMMEVYSALGLPGGRLLAGASLSWTGPAVMSSDDDGRTWSEHRVAFPEGVDASVERVWQLVPGVEDGVVWAGTEPGAIFRSEDHGETWELVRGLWDHPHRPEWNEGFGGQAFHTILPHPTDPASVTAAISTGGVYQTRDGGETWEARNQGIKAEFMPGERSYPEFGQCVHKMARHPDRPERIYLQNHGGVYRSDDEAGSWTSIADGLPTDFGFSVVVHPHEPDTIYVFPIGAGDNRWPPGALARVWRSRDAGEHWEELAEGLPGDFYTAVMRDGMCADAGSPVGVYFGARNGSVWGSADEGSSWRELIANLPDVLAVKTSA